ncbi:ABC transporter permease [Granulicella mallensis]|uniref:ABC-2 type transport system permease protein n=1 Tax=Granulicella mallensis TaxID=940614 RepID=A0A7W7ZSL8_9BACT|nr:ABC transporter permease [Granulicella mallensis]MBB5065407.1 ABC-2 type transport system permease protein [Granulicella mallensis]
MSTTTLSVSTIPANDLMRSLPIFAREARFEFVRLLRTRTFSLSVIGFPVMFYILFGLLMNRGESLGGITVAKYMLGGYAVFGLVGAALFGIGVGMAGDFSAGWLELKRASPMPPLAYLLAKCCTAMAFGAIIVSLLTALGIVFGHVHLTLDEYAHMIAFSLAGAIPFASLGLVVALIVPFNSAPGIANLIYLPMSFCSGLWVPFQLLPHAVKAIAPFLPTYHLAQLMLGALGAPSSGTANSHWSNLLGFTLLMLGIAWIAFRRREQNA